MYRDHPVAPNVLACAGLDPSGGAGLLADARVIGELGARPVGVVTTLTVQNTTGVVDGHVVDPELLESQLVFLLQDVQLAAVKLGMLGSAATAVAVARALAATDAPVVWDPVIHPSRGELPRADGWIADALVALVPHVTVITPNAHELALLTGIENDPLAAGRKVVASLNIACLVKGGHLGGDHSVDILLTIDGATHVFDGKRLPGGEDVHGTGCALSSAIAARLALGDDLPTACRTAKAYVADHIARAVSPGRGASAIV